MDEQTERVNYGLQPRTCVICERPIQMKDSKGRWIKVTKHPRCQKLYRKHYNRQYKRAQRAAEEQDRWVTELDRRNVKVNAIRGTRKELEELLEEERKIVRADEIRAALDAPPPTDGG